jgi:hypothetical protein
VLKAHKDHKEIQVLKDQVAQVESVAHKEIQVLKEIQAFKDQVVLVE